MTTVLRLAIPLMSGALIVAGAFVLALGTLDERVAPVGVILGGAVALPAVVVPPAIVGAFVSVWAWDDRVGRRLRILVWVLLLAQLAGIAGLIAVSTQAPATAVGLAAIVVLVIAEYPIGIGLGRTVRRREASCPGRR